MNNKSRYMKTSLLHVYTGTENMVTLNQEEEIKNSTWKKQSKNINHKMNKNIY